MEPMTSTSASRGPSAPSGRMAQVPAIKPAGRFDEFHPT